MVEFSNANRPSAEGGETIRAPITAKQVVQVALNPDDELRNQQVALLYSLSSARLNERLFGTDARGNPVGVPESPTNANWFTFAQWAVLTVGRNIRTTTPPLRTGAVAFGLRRWLAPLALSARTSADRRVAAALSYGQILVFTSIYAALLKSELADGAPDRTPASPDGPIGESDPDADVGESPVDAGTVAMAPDDVRALAEFARRDQEHTVREQRQQKQEERERRLQIFQIAEALGADVQQPIRGEADESFYRRVLRALAELAGHERELDEAFALYVRATATGQADEDRSPADLVFEANLRLMAVEQFVLDGAVTMVVDHLPQVIADEVEGRITVFAERAFRVPRRVAQVNASRRLSSITALGRDAWARVMADQLMVVSLPSETIRIGRDMPPVDWREEFASEHLRRLSPESQDLFDMFDRSSGNGRGAGASDWRRFDDRMNFVANLALSRQQDPTLFWQPFTVEDAERVWAGKYPQRFADPFVQSVRAPTFPRGLREKR